jgi:RNA polymerase sigma-70 factor (ECF subfamily)
LQDAPDVTGQQDIKQWFSRKVGENMDAMYGVALHLTGNSVNAEDLVAETVVKAWSNIESLEDRDRWRPWIFRILRNEFISHHRKKSVRPREISWSEEPGDEDGFGVSSILMEQPEEFLNWWASPEQELINGLLGEQIRGAIEKLPEAFRMTILLVNVDGLSYDEASVVLGVPFGTIRSRMKRGRTILQRALWTQAHEAGLSVAREQLGEGTGA